MSRPDKVDNVDEGLIHAWLDGELTGEEAARVERLAATDAAWSAAVAEARGFIAASSRIVGALDAVPARVIPAGSKAAPARGLRVRPWMRVAAGVALLVGTAYTVREMNAPTSVVSAVAEPVAPPVVAPPPPVANAVDDRREDRRADAPAPQPAVVAPTPAPVPTIVAPALGTQKAEAERFAAQAQERTLAEFDRAAATATPATTATQQRARRESAPSQASRAALAAPSRDAVAGAAAGPPSAAPSLGALEGCWRATAPDSLVALYRDPTILRERGDTLVLILPNAIMVTVVRRDDSLRGALTATRVSCPPESSRSPRDSR